MSTCLLEYPLTWYSIGTLVSFLCKGDFCPFTPPSLHCNGEDLFPGAGGPSIIIQHLKMQSIIYTKVTSQSEVIIMGLSWTVTVLQYINPKSREVSLKMISHGCMNQGARFFS